MDRDLQNHQEGTTIMVEKTLVLIKPDGVKRGLVGRIIQRFEDVGYKIVATKMVWADTELTQKHYKEHVDKPFYEELEELLTMGPVMAMVLEGVSAIEKTRQMIGTTEPKSAAPGTIRGDFASLSYEYADENKDVIFKNLVHASDSPESAETEINLWFDEADIHDYDTVHEAHTRR